MAVSKKACTGTRVVCGLHGDGLQYEKRGVPSYVASFIAAAIAGFAKVCERIEGEALEAANGDENEDTARLVTTKIKDQARACLDRLFAIVVPVTFGSASNQVEMGPISVSGGFIDSSMSPVEARRLLPSISAMTEAVIVQMKSKQTWSSFLAAASLLSPPGGALFAGISADTEEVGEAATIEHDPSLVCLRRECRGIVAEKFPEICKTLVSLATASWDAETYARLCALRLLSASVNTLNAKMQFGDGDDDRECNELGTAIRFRRAESAELAPSPRKLDCARAINFCIRELSDLLDDSNDDVRREAISTLRSLAPLCVSASTTVHSGASGGNVTRPVLKSILKPRSRSRSRSRSVSMEGDDDHDHDDEEEEVETHHVRFSTAAPEILGEKKKKKRHKGGKKRRARKAREEAAKADATTATPTAEAVAPEYRILEELLDAVLAHVRDELKYDKGAEGEDEALAEPVKELLLLCKFLIALAPELSVKHLDAVRSSVDTSTAEPRFDRVLGDLESHADVMAVLSKKRRKNGGKQEGAAGADIPAGGGAEVAARASAIPAAPAPTVITGETHITKEKKKKKKKKKKKSKAQENDTDMLDGEMFEIDE